MMPLWTKISITILTVYGVYVLRKLLKWNPKNMPVNKFKIIIGEWFEDDYGDYASLTILINDIPATEVYDYESQTYRSNVYLPVDVLSLWFDYYKDSDFSLSEIGEGWVWPSISFKQNGNNINIKMVSDPVEDHGACLVRYINDIETSISRKEYSEVIDQLLLEVNKHYENTYT